MSTTTETITRPPRAPAASVVLTVAAVVTAVLLAPVSSAAAAEPLPAGTYEVMVDPGTVSVAVDGAGGVAITASDGLTVTLRFDDAGHALDEFTVDTDEADYLVEVDVADDGTYTTSVERTEEDLVEDTAGRDVVTTVARCAPTGMVARAAGWPNHGTLVSLAASGLPFAAEVVDPLSGEVTRVEADFSDLAGAAAFCELVDGTVPSAEEVRTSLAEQREAARSDREAARAEREAAREVAQRAREAQRAARQTAQGADQAARAEERRPAQETRRDTRQEGVTQRDADRPSEEPAPPATDAAPEDTTAPSSPPGDGGTDDTTTTDSPATSPVNGNGNGPPPDAGAKGNGKDR